MTKHSIPALSNDVQYMQYFLLLTESRIWRCMQCCVDIVPWFLTHASSIANPSDLTFPLCHSTLLVSNLQLSSHRGHGSGCGQHTGPVIESTGSDSRRNSAHVPRDRTLINTNYHNASVPDSTFSVKVKIPLNSAFTSSSEIQPYPCRENTMS